MLINQPAMVLNLASVAVMTLLMATALQALTLIPAARFLARLAPDAQKKALWLFVNAPWAVSIVCVLICLPSLLRLEHPFWLDQIVHWHYPFGVFSRCQLPGFQERIRFDSPFKQSEHAPAAFRYMAAMTSLQINRTVFI